jgi:hypothetical protein
MMMLARVQTLQDELTWLCRDSDAHPELGFPARTSLYQ